MDADAYRHIAEIFRSLVGEPGDVQQARLAELSDPALRAHLQAMLEADAIASRVFARARAEPEDAPPPAQVGPWRIVREIGRGGMGVVYEAAQEQPSRRVALKVVSPALRGPDTADLLRREAQAMSELRHPAIPAVYGAGEDDGAPWVAMELVDGLAWTAFCTAASREERVTTLAAVARAIAFAHSRGIVHRDLKPGNVLVVDGHPRILDFGIAAAQGRWEGVRGGSAAYMAPEQRDGADAGDGRVDVYALGVLLAETLAGVRDPGAIDDPELAAVARRATAARPDDRFATVGAFADDLERWLAGYPVAASPAGVALRLRKWLRRNRVPLLAGAGTLGLAAALAGAGLAGAAWSDARAQAERERRAAERLAQTVAATATAPPDAVDAAWGAFVALDENRGTVAVGEGWRRWAAARDAREDNLGARDAWAEAYAASPDVDGRRASLLGLAGVFRARWEYEALARVLDRLATLGPTDDVRRLRAEADLALGRPVADPDALPPGARPLVDALTPVTRTTQPAGAIPHRPTDVDGDGVAELLVTDGARLVALRADRTLAAVGAIIVDGGAGVVVRGDAPWLVSGRGGRCAVHRIDLARPGGAEEVLQWPCAAVLSADWADPDGDGRGALYVGVGPYDREIAELRPDGGRWVVRTPAADTTQSDPDAVVAADLDGDGRDELAIAAGAWRAYDVRVYRADGPDDHLALAARRTLGWTTALAAVRLDRDHAGLAAFHERRYGNAEVFDDADPYGGPPGLIWLALRGDTLAEVRRDVLSDRSLASHAPTGFVYGDFDGDGHTDAAGALTGDGDGVWVVRGGPTADSFVLEGLSPLAAADLDGDGDDELVAVEDGRVVALGTGDGRRAPRPPRLPAPLPAPALADPLADAAWERAEDLVAMGIIAPAARQLEAAARWLGPTDAPHALIRAAELREGHDPPQALALYRAAVDAAAEDDVVAALDGVARVAEATHDPGAAVEALDRLIARSTGATRDAAIARRDRLVPLASASRVDVRLAPLDPRWRVDPLALGRVGDALEVVGGRGVRELAVLPVRFDGGRIGVDVTLDVEADTWGASLVIALRPVGGPTALGVGVDGSGGGGVEGRIATCGTATSTLTGPLRPEPPEPERESLHLAADLDPGRREAWCTLDGPPYSASGAISAVPVPAGDGELVVVDRSGADAIYPIRVRIRGLTLRGVALRDVADDAVAAARRATVDGAPPWPMPAGASDTDAMVAALVAGRSADAARIAGAMRDADALLLAYARFPDVFEPVLRAQAGFWDRFVRAWMPTIRRAGSARGARVLDRPVLDTLTGASAAEREILLARGRAAAAAGRSERARADLGRVVTRAGPDEAASVTDARLWLATLDLRDGHVDDARRMADAAIAGSPTPWLTAERWARIAR